MQKDKITLPFGKHVSKRSCSSKQLIVRLSSETWLNKGSYWVKSFNFPLSDFVRLELLLLLSKGGPVKKDKFVTCSWHVFTKSESTNFLLFSFKQGRIQISAPNGWRAGIAVNVTQRRSVFKPITWYAKSRTTKSIPGLYSFCNNFTFMQ